MPPVREGFTDRFYELVGRRETWDDHRFSYEDQRRALILAPQGTLDWWIERSGLPVYPMDRETLTLPAGRVLRGLSFNRCVLSCPSDLRFERCAVINTSVSADTLIFDRSSLTAVKGGTVAFLWFLRSICKQVQFVRVECTFRMSQTEAEDLTIEHLHARDSKSWIEQSYLKGASIYFRAVRALKIKACVLESSRFTVMGAVDRENVCERGVTWHTMKTRLKIEKSGSVT